MEKILHAYILTGDAESTLAAAWDKAKAVLCEAGEGKPCGVCRQCRKIEKRIHPDVVFITREEDDKGRQRREILVDQIRALEKDALILPNDAANKVYIFPEADAMNEKAQNAFLKLLEEPPSFVTFLLCTQSRDALLETIRSRCGEIRLNMAQTAYSEGAVLRAEEYLKSRGNRVALWSCCTAWEALDNPALSETIGCLRQMAVDKIGDRGELMFLEQFLAKAEEYLQVNVGIKHITGYLSTYLLEAK